MNGAAIKQIPQVPDTLTITEAWLYVWRNPSLFIKYWNYKGAVLSGVLRAPIFLATYLIGKEGLKLAIAAASIQFLLRFFVAGLGGALIQSFRRVEPPWKALISVMLILPFVSHILEFVIQVGFAYATGTQDRTEEAILRSISVSIISALFTLFAMRRGLMIVGESESKSLLSDVSRLPVVIFYFIVFIPNEIAAMFRRGAHLGALLAIFAFGIFSQVLVWALVNKPSWTYSGGKEVFMLKYWGVNGMILLVLVTIISAIHLDRKHKRIAAENTNAD